MLRNVLIACLVLTLVGCSSDSVVSASASTDSAPHKSPLSNYLGLDIDLYDPTSQVTVQVESDEAIKECMAEQGFEWQPFLGGAYRFLGDPDDGLEFATEAWVEKYGFGISTLAFPQSSVGPDLVGYPDDLHDSGYEYDPNEPYFESLSPAEQAAYREALYGKDEGLDIDSETMTAEEEFAAMHDYLTNDELSGCYGSFQAQQVTLWELDFSLGPEIEAMYEDAANDPRMAEETQRVVTCVEDKGFTLAEGNAFEPDIRAQLSSLEDAVSRSLGDDEFNVDDVDDPDGQSVELDFPELTAEQKAELGEIQAQEIATAKAAKECGGPVNVIPSLQAEVFAEYEESFIEENRAALDSIKAATVDESESSD